MIITPFWSRTWGRHAEKSWVFAPACTAKNQYRTFETKILKKGIARPQSQFPHSCLCEWFIYCIPRIGLHIFLCSRIGKPRVHCKENPIYVFLFWELRGLSPNVHIHVSVGDLYIPRIGPHTVFPCSRIGRPILEIYKSLTYTWMWKSGLRLRNSRKGNT